MSGVTQIFETVEPGATGCYQKRDMLTGLHLQLARRATGQTIDEVAEITGLSHATIARAEAARGIPALKATNLFELQRAYENAGIVFLDNGQASPDGGIGIRFRNRSDEQTRREREKARETFAGRLVRSLTPDEMERAHQAGYEPDGEYLIGRDPREMTQAELKAAGHEPMSPMQAIRAKCLDCCAGSPHEVRCCVAVACPSWPFRTGKNPWRAPMSEERRQALRNRNPFLSKPHKTGDEISEDGLPVLDTAPDDLC
jgi:transcriptional regulator with XRE-family HTH domain